MPPPNEQAIPITSLDAQQLRHLRDKVEMEAQRLSSSRMQLQRVAAAFTASQNAIDSLSKAQQGQEILLPLSGSLYISGKLASVDEVLVDVGTGYFLEKSVGEGADYCKRKVERLAGNIQELAELLQEKQNILGQLNQVLASKLAAAQAGQSQQSS